MATARALAWRALIVAVALLLVWRAFHINAIAYEDTGTPRLAAAVDAAQGLRAVIAANPAEATALALLARQLETAGDRNSAMAAYRVALPLAPLDRDVLAASADAFLRWQDEAAAPLLVRLARNFDDLRAPAFAALERLLDSPASGRYVAQVLREDGPLLSAFVADACARKVDPRRLLPLVLAGSASLASSACVIEALRAEGRWTDAHQLWINLLPKERRGHVGYVFNGGFEAAPLPGGFDWQLAGGDGRSAGHVAEILRIPGEGRTALRVAYNGRRQAGPPARQLLALPPGEYEFTAHAKPLSVKALRGVHWTLRCQPAGTLLGSSDRFLGSDEWRLAQFAFTVPAACAGQVLQLEPVAEGPAFIEGTLWIDDVRVRFVGR